MPICMWEECDEKAFEQTLQWHKIALLFCTSSIKQAAKKKQIVIKKYFCQKYSENEPQNR